MKKVLLVLAMVALTFGMNAQVTPKTAQLVVDDVNKAVESTQQEWSKGFPHGEIEKIVGKRIKGDTISAGLQKYGFSSLYRSESMRTSQVWEGNGSYATKYEAVVNKIFTVVSATSYLDVLKARKFKVKLISENGETVWMKYDESYSHAFKFLIEGGFEVSDEYFCSTFVSESYDEFEDETTYRTKVTDGYKLIRAGDTYYLRVSTPASTTGAIGGKGLQLILMDGERLSWPDADLNTKVNSSKYIKGYIVSAFVRLTEDQLNKLSKSNPRKAKLYIFTRGFGGSYDWARSFRCVMNK